MPYEFADCPHCNKENSYDRAMLDQTAIAAKGITVYRAEADDFEEFVVTCKHCLKKYKIKLQRRKDDNHAKA